MNTFGFVILALSGGMILLASGYLIGMLQERTHQQTHVRNEVSERRSLAERLAKAQGECDHWQTSNRKWRGLFLELAAKASSQGDKGDKGEEKTGDPVSVGEADRRAVVARVQRAKQEEMLMHPVAIAERDVAPPPRLRDREDDQE